MSERRGEMRGVAEVANRIIAEGTRCASLQSLLADTSRPMVSQRWTSFYNATAQCKKGSTLWSGDAVKSSRFLFGAIVLFRTGLGSQTHTLGNFDERVFAAILA